MYLMEDQHDQCESLEKSSNANNYSTAWKLSQTLEWQCKNIKNYKIHTNKAVHKIKMSYNGKFEFFINFKLISVRIWAKWVFFSGLSDW